MAEPGWKPMKVSRQGIIETTSHALLPGGQIHRLGGVSGTAGLSFFRAQAPRPLGRLVPFRSAPGPSGLA
jgi:hypothetical protein